MLLKMIAEIDLKSVGGHSSVENTFSSRPVYLKCLALEMLNRTRKIHRKHLMLIGMQRRKIT